MLAGGGGGEFELESETETVSDMKTSEAQVALSDAERGAAEKARTAAGDAPSNESAGAAEKYRRAVLGSSLAAWFSERGGGGAPMPVPEIPAEAREPFVRLMDEILAARAANPSADADLPQWDLDRLVYDLYGLTDDEETAVERSLGLIHACDDDEDAALARAMDDAAGSDWVSKGEALRLSRARSVLDLHAG